MQSRSSRGAEPIASPADLGRYPLIHYDWFVNDRLSPNWKRWFEAACGAPELWTIAFSFKEEAHAIEAALAGQGVTLCSDVVVADELASGALVKAFDFGLPGGGFYPVFALDHPRRDILETFVHWLRGMAARSVSFALAALARDLALRTGCRRRSRPRRLRRRRAPGGARSSRRG